MSSLYIIAGCNGAGKTTASFTVLPDMLNCDEFINADEIARGISPLNPEKAAIDAGRLMLSLIGKLINARKNFAFETTLSSKSYVKTIQKAKQQGFDVTLVFYWLDTVELAIERVKARVVEGGHNIPEKVISRRYYSGLKNLFDLYIPICDYWMIFNNSNSPSQLIAEGYTDTDVLIKNAEDFTQLKKKINYDKAR